MVVLPKCLLYVKYTAADHFVTVVVVDTSNFSTALIVALFFLFWQLPFKWHPVLPVPSVCLCLRVFQLLPPPNHPTTSLPCFPYHSLFLWADICGKINQTQTSHLSSQINFAPLYNLGRTINFTHKVRTPIRVSACNGKSCFCFSFLEMSFPTSCVQTRNSVGWV